MATQRELIVKLKVQNKELKAGLKKSEKQLEKFSKNSEKNVSKLSSGISNAGKLIAGAFVADRVLALGKAIFDVTAEFQKMEAVLTNTLGSSSAAQRALLDINKFASSTPFAVSELTDAYVKLSNQGLQPSQEELRQLGDLAASTGKSFDQLAEAVIDAAASGEFERLKEFGVRTKRDGDKLQFTFKGITTEVDNTSESIRRYVTGLGDVEGVSGSMAAISKTLEGRVSNLGDAWDNLFRTIGAADENSVFGKAIGELTNLLNFYAEKFKTARQEAKEWALEMYGPERLARIEKRIGLEEALARKQDKLNKLQEMQKKGSEALTATQEREILRLEATIKILQDYGLEVENATIKETEASKKRQEEMKKERAEIMRLDEARLAFLKSFTNAELKPLTTGVTLGDRTAFGSLIGGTQTQQMKEFMEANTHEIDKQNIALEEQAAIAEELSSQTTDFASALLDASTAGQDLGQTMEMVLKQMLIDLAKAAALATIFGALTGGAGGTATGLAKFLPGIGSLLSGGGGGTGSGANLRLGGQRLVTEVSGRDLQIILDRENTAQSR